MLGRWDNEGREERKRGGREWFYGMSSETRD